VLPEHSEILVHLVRLLAKEVEDIEDSRADGQQRKRPPQHPEADRELCEGERRDGNDGRGALRSRGFHMTRTANEYLTETYSGWQACVHVSSAQNRSCARTTLGLTVTTFLSLSTAVEHWPLPGDISVLTGPRVRRPITTNLSSFSLTL